MKLSDFDYPLPEELIAAVPAKERTGSRLFCYTRQSLQRQHTQFSDIASWFVPGDVLVLNNTRVLPARLYGKRQTGGQAEALLLTQLSQKTWSVLLKPSGRIKRDARIIFEKDGHCLEAIVLDDAKNDSGQRTLEFQTDDLLQALELTGFIPLPPYIDRMPTEYDAERYQTVFAQCSGAIAAPTAGLHFDELLLQTLKNKGVQVVTVTLHVGYGTFQPVTFEDPSQHRMHEESFVIDAAAAESVNEACRQKRRIIACGTTCVRVLETAAVGAGQLVPTKGVTDIFIYPPYSFKIVSGLITNFHLPKTTLLMLVAAFLGSAGQAMLLDLYKEAIRERYRFFSYGDAMLLL